MKFPETMSRLFSSTQSLGTDHYGELFRVVHNHSKTVHLLRILYSYRPNSINPDTLNSGLLTLQSLHSPNIGFIRRFFLCEDNRIAVMMDDVPGLPIASNLYDLKLKPEAIRSFALQVGETLEYLHQNNVSHLSLSPWSVFISTEGEQIRFSLIDAGLCDILGRRSLHDLHDSDFHKAAMFMSPEYLSGKFVSYRSDLYSFGILLYVMATGQNPFESDSISGVISAQLHRPVQNPANSGLSPDCSDFVMRLLARNPECRPSSALEFTSTSGPNALSPSTLPPSNEIFLDHSLPRREIQSAFKDACNGSGCVLTIVGDSGIGKSRLLEDIAAEYRLSGASPLVIDANSDAGTFSGRKILKELFEFLESNYSGISSGLIDTIYRLDFETDYLLMADPIFRDNVVRQCAHQVFNAVANRSNQLNDPSIFILKNCHFDDSIFWLFFLTLSDLLNYYSATPCSCLWIIETDSILPGTPQRSPKNRLIELVEFNTDQTRILLSHRFGFQPVPEAVIDWVMELSNGNPSQMDLIASILEQARIVSWVDGLWTFNEDCWKNLQSFHDVIQLTGWFIEHHLPSEIKLLFQHLSLWSSGCTLNHLAFSFESSNLVDNHFQEAFSTGWIIRKQSLSDIYYSFKFQAFRRYLIDQIPFYQRTAYHLLIAGKLQTYPNTHPELIAEHYFNAENRLHGCEFARQAARIYRDTACLERAIFWFAKILEHMPDRNRAKIADINFEYGKLLIAALKFSEAQIALAHAEPILESRFHQKREKAQYLMNFGICYVQIADFELAREHFEEALQYLPQTTAFDYKLKILTYLGQALIHTNDYKSMIVHFDTYEKTLPFSEFPYFAANLMDIMARIHLGQHQYGSSEYFLKEAIRYGAFTGDNIIQLCRHLSLGQIYEKNRKYRSAAEEFERVIVLSRKNASPAVLCRSLCSAVTLMLTQNRLDDIEAMLDEASFVSAQLNDLQLQLWSHILQSSLYIKKGQLDLAEEILCSINTPAHLGTDLNLSNRFYLNLALIAERRGDFSKHLTICENLLQQVHLANQPVFIAFSSLYLGRAHYLLDQLQQAAECINQARSILDEHQISVPDCDILDALIQVKLNKHKEARKLATNALSLAKNLELLHQQAEAWRTFGLIEIQENNFENALTHFKQAVELFKAEQDGFDVAKTYQSIANTYRSLGKSTLADQEMQQANKIFKQLSAFTYVSDFRKTNTEKADKSLSLSFSQFELVSIVRLLESLFDKQNMHQVLLQMIASFGKFHQCALFTSSHDSDQLLLSAHTGFSSKELDGLKQRCFGILFNPDNAEPIVDEVLLNPQDQTRINICSMILPVWIDREYVVVIVGNRAQMEKAFFESLVKSLSDFVSTAFRISDSIGLVKNRDPNHRPRSTSIISDLKIIAESKIMSTIKDALMSLAFSRQPLLISGSIGTGKSYLAEAIHQLGRSPLAPRAIILCRTLASARKSQALNDQIESAMVGSGFSQISPGSIVLEDIDLLPSELQKALLDRLTGADNPSSNFRAQCRYIFTTTKSLRREVQDGLFSENLYRVISELHIHLPDLVDRKEDVSHFARQFLQEASHMTQKPFSGFSPQALDALMSYHWPENIIEMKYAIESAALFGTPPTMHAKDLPKTIRSYLERSGVLGPDKPVLRSIEDIEESHIRAILQGTNGNKFRACELLGISRPTLDRKMEKFGISIQKKRKR